MPTGGPDVGIVGLRQFMKDLEALGVSSTDMKQAMNRVGNIVVQQARQIVPVKSGRLSSSIRASQAKNSATIRAGYNASVPYAGVIHFGWPKRNIRKTVFLYRASEATRGQVIAALRNELDKLIQDHNLSN